LICDIQQSGGCVLRFGEIHYSIFIEIKCFTSIWLPANLPSPLPQNEQHEHKGKIDPITCPEDIEGEWRYTCTLSLTSALTIWILSTKYGITKVYEIS
jgi:hypothetical protein